MVKGFYEELDILTMKKCSCGDFYEFIFQLIEERVKGVLYCASCCKVEVLFTVAQLEYCLICHQGFPETELEHEFCRDCRQDEI